MRFLLLFLTLATTSWAVESWPRFRGTDGRGVSAAEVPVKFDKETLQWFAELPGSGSSSPVIWGDALFITGEDSEKKTVSLVCLDAKSGRSRWSKSLQVGDYHMHRFNNTAAASPAANADVVVVSWFDGAKEIAMLSAFDHVGKRLWDYQVGPFKGQHGVTIHPAINEGRVILSHLHQGDAYLAALDAKSGKEIWKTPCPGDKTSYVTPLVRDLAGGGKEVVVSSQSMGVAGFDFQTGKQNWLLSDVMKQRTIVSPIDVLSGSGNKDCLIAVGCKSGTYFALRPPLENGDSPKIIWKMKGNTPYVPTPVSDGKMVYSVSDGGVLVAMVAATGEKKWEQKLMGNFYASPLLIGGKLYCLSREGEMIVAEVGEAYREIARSQFDLGGSQWADATPAVAHQQLYVRVGARIDCFSSAK
ncbi:PQQ-binding-like beta-propeller repeat protein [Akkermansiaceae bacterium]|nr:PQQ-binding-like beta-propeller repeat protein [Akkermansiaceae bacterium]MDB4577737.1 PQQ-binding-like beta-propeller repeat protein [Akkermansiaceae bacterium]